MGEVPLFGSACIAAIGSVHQPGEGHGGQGADDVDDEKSGQ